MNNFEVMFWYSEFHYLHTSMGTENHDSISKYLSDFIKTFRRRGLISLRLLFVYTRVCMRDAFSTASY